MKKDREIDLSVKIENTCNYTCILYRICIGNIPS